MIFNKWYAFELSPNQWMVGYDKENGYWTQFVFRLNVFPNPFDAYFYLLENFKEEEIV